MSGNSKNKVKELKPFVYIPLSLVLSFIVRVTLLLVSSLSTRILLCYFNIKTVLEIVMCANK
jgi:hypothetical protein